MSADPFENFPSVAIVDPLGDFLVLFTLLQALEEDGAYESLCLESLQLLDS